MYLFGLVGMNDFTKEELNYIADGISLIVYRCEINPPQLKDKLINLNNKIQSLINNYCEHKKEPIGGWVSKCINCGMKFGDETQ